MVGGLLLLILSFTCSSNVKKKNHFQIYASYSIVTDEGVYVHLLRIDICGIIYVQLLYLKLNGHIYQVGDY